MGTSFLSAHHSQIGHSLELLRLFPFFFVLPFFRVFQLLEVFWLLFADLLPLSALPDDGLNPAENTRALRVQQL